MQNSILRYMLFNNTLFQERVLILAVGVAHDFLNEQSMPEYTEAGLARIQAKAAELINNPDGFRNRLVYSVVAKLNTKDVDEGVDDTVLNLLLLDIIDGLAGVPPSEKTS